ncbi:MAG: creatininase family protein [Ardenticatenia bacterium]|nr:creatininase family protein [Ardenticatenia bacterium]
MTTTHRYAELHPDALARLIEAGAPAIVPWGALEWHGPHLPLGLDGLVADAFAERLAPRVDGVLFPTTWWAATTLPHALSLQIPSSLFAELVKALLEELHRLGFGRVALISGHYAHPHELLLMEAAEQALAQHGLLVLAAPPLALLGEEYLDHAARWETSQLLAVRPELVRLELLDALGTDDAAQALTQTAVLGQDPRQEASPAQGKAVLDEALQAWAERVAALSPSWLTQFYRRRRAAYNSWLERFFRGDWEAALITWWRDRTGQP